jgi:hypothetical protein
VATGKNTTVTYQIVGVAQDIRRDVRRPGPMFYLSQLQTESQAFSTRFLVRTRLDPAAVIPGLRSDDFRTALILGRPFHVVYNQNFPLPSCWNESQSELFLQGGEDRRTCVVACSQFFHFLFRGEFQLDVEQSVNASFVDNRTTVPRRVGRDATPRSGTSASPDQYHAWASGSQRCSAELCHDRGRRYDQHKRRIVTLQSNSPGPFRRCHNGPFAGRH